MPASPAGLTAVRHVAASRRRGRWPLVVVALFLIAMVVASRAVDLSRHVETAQAWTAALGILAPGAFVVVYVAATLVGVPGTPFTLLSPFLFGPPTAFVVMVVASSASAAAGFLIARYLASDSSRERLGETDGFARLARLVAAHDWIVIPFLRIVPVAPFAIVNYGFGLTRIGFWRYFFWTELAMVPMNALLILGADVFYGAAVRGTVSGPGVAAAAVAALLVAGLVAVGLRKLARA
ncbi:MAG TPA: VTT domain-containing protein [Methylomirabilota bacterium]